MSGERIIKKYPNRRLYDTAISSYITLEDVRRLVFDNVKIKVIDARSQEDITHSTLLQIIIEQEEKGPSLFSTESLQQMIRFYGSSFQHLLGKMFDQGMNFFTEQQGFLQKDYKQADANNIEQDPMSMMNTIMQNNISNWQKLQSDWLKAMQFPFGGQQTSQTTQEQPDRNEPKGEITPASAD